MVSKKIFVLFFGLLIHINLGAVFQPDTLQWLAARRLAQTFTSTDDAIALLTATGDAFLPNLIATYTALAYALLPDTEGAKISSTDRVRVLNAMLERGVPVVLVPIVEYMRDLFVKRASAKRLAARPFSHIYRTNTRCLNDASGSMVYCAVRDKQLDALRWLLTHSVGRLNIPTRFGETPVHAAVKTYGDDEFDTFVTIMDMLVVAGADINYVDTFFRDHVGRPRKSPLELAQTLSERDGKVRSRIIEHLRERIADLAGEERE